VEVAFAARAAGCRGRPGCGLYLTFARA
jgi:hypothetical protein